MSTDMHKNKWIDEVMDSTKGMRKAEPGADLYEQVMQKMSTATPVRNLPISVTRWVAAAVVLLALNVGSVVYYAERKKNTTASANPIETIMQADQTYNY